MKRLLLLILISFFLSACSDRLGADEISKMNEDQIKLVTAEQIGKMTPGELEVFKTRRSFFSDERTRIEKENAKKISGSERLKKLGI